MPGIVSFSFSTFRQIPDHQEVYVDANHPDQSFILELLEPFPGTGLDVFNEHFNTLSQDNSSCHTVLKHVEILNPQTNNVKEAFIGYGEFQVSKWNRPTEATDIVNVILTVLRLQGEGYKSDVLATLYTPTDPKPWMDWMIKEWIPSFVVNDPGLFK